MKRIFSLLGIVIMLVLTLSQNTLAQSDTPTLQKAMITFTFDDGLASVYTQALPALDAHNFPATVFPIVGGINRSWAVSWDQLWTMYNTHNWEVGNHTWDHQSFTGYSTGQPPLTDAEIINEIRTARSVLEEHGLINVTCLAYPYGDFNDHIIALLQADGTLYSARNAGCGWGACSNSLDNFNQWSITAINCGAPYDFNTIKAYIDQAILDKTWLVLQFHDIIPDGTPNSYETLRSVLDEIVEYVYQNRQSLDVVTISQGDARMHQQLSLLNP